MSIRLLIIEDKERVKKSLLNRVSAVLGQEIEEIGWVQDLETAKSTTQKLLDDRIPPDLIFLDLHIFTSPGGEEDYGAGIEYLTFLSKLKQQKGETFPETLRVFIITGQYDDSHIIALWRQFPDLVYQAIHKLNFLDKESEEAQQILGKYKTFYEDVKSRKLLEENDGDSKSKLQKLAAQGILPIFKIAYKFGESTMDPKNGTRLWSDSMLVGYNFMAKDILKLKGGGSKTEVFLTCEGAARYRHAMVYNRLRDRYREEYVQDLQLQDEALEEKVSAKLQEEYFGPSLIITSSYPLSKYIANILTPGGFSDFVRINQSTVVNWRYVRMKYEGHLVLIDDSSPVENGLHVARSVENITSMGEEAVKERFF